MSDTSTCPPVDLAGLTLPLETWDELKFFFASTRECDDLTLSDLLERGIREWLALQGAAIRMREEDDPFVARKRAEDKAERAKRQRRVKKAKQALKGLPENVARIDTAWGFRSEA
jgi:hypothetical protein